MTFDEYQSALTAAHKAYRSVPKTSESIDAYQKQTGAIHAQYRAEKAASPAPVTEYTRRRRQLRDARAIAKYEEELLQLQDDVKAYAHCVRIAEWSYKKCEDDGCFSDDGGETRKIDAAAQIERSKIKLKRAQDALARIVDVDPRKYA